MRKPLLLTLVAVCCVQIAMAQMPFFTRDSVDINNITAGVMVHGDMFWDPALGEPTCSFPAHAATHINFASALWMSGYDGGGQLHVAAQTYRQKGNDYWPGPLNASAMVTYATSTDWAKIWKVNRIDIQYFQSISTHTTTNTPSAILTWPAKGNANAQGNAGAPLTIATDMAPFVDLNHNGIYEPLLGDYPDVPGDQALWWVFSDNGPTHDESAGRPLGVEVHAMAYAYKRGTPIDNVIYYDYNVINRSANSYHNFRMGLFDDVDLGYAFDDFIGFDSTHRMGIDYNGSNDDGAAGGHPVNSYGANIPIVGVSMIILPGDDLIAHTHVPAGSFMYYNNDFSVYGNPSEDTEYNHLLRSSFRTGVHLKNDFAGPGVPSTGYGAGADCDYVFTGDPSVSTQWSECVSNNLPGDRRFIITSNDFTLAPAATQQVVMALLAVNPAANNGCPFSGFAGIESLADTAWNVFYNPPAPIPPTAVTNLPGAGFKIYPNPAKDRLIMETPYNSPGENITVYNTMGQQVNIKLLENGQKRSLDISGLPAGLYNILYRNGSFQTTAMFVKD
jgi:hypothetical protein